MTAKFGCGGGRGPRRRYVCISACSVTATDGNDDDCDYYDDVLGKQMSTSNMFGYLDLGLDPLWKEQTKTHSNSQAARLEMESNQTINHNERAIDGATGPTTGPWQEAPPPAVSEGGSH